MRKYEEDLPTVWLHEVVGVTTDEQAVRAALHSWAVLLADRVQQRLPALVERYDDTTVTLSGQDRDSVAVSPK